MELLPYTDKPARLVDKGGRIGRQNLYRRVGPPQQVDCDWPPIMHEEKILVGWLFGFYGISTFVGYLMPNPFICK